MLLSRCPNSLWLLVTALLVAIATATGPQAAAKVPGTVRPSDHRVIIRFPDDASDGPGRTTRLDQQVEKLQGRAQVLSAKGLPHLGMIVAVCGTQEAQEQLIEDLDRDSEVELAVPDTWVTADDFKGPAATGPHAEGAAVPLQRQLASALQSFPAVCSAHPACAARGLVGDCCPAKDGTVLSCCAAGESARVALRSYHGRYVSADRNGAVTARAEAVEDASTFSIVLHDDGTVSLKSFFGKYLAAEEWGGVAANRDQVGTWEQFGLVRNENGTVSLKSRWDKYIVAEDWGGIFANRAAISTWEQFALVNVQGPGQRFPNDPALPSLWGMHHYAANDIDAPEAWRVWTGEVGAGITLGVIDTGIDYKHEDLREQMWVNPNEIPGNGIDDDENGFIDDIHGADFANEDGDPWDDQMHGTHCSGTIAGSGNNGVGVAGVAWRGVRLMGLKFLSASGSGRTSDAIKAIEYGIAHGAKILSNSWGGGGSSSALRVAIERAAAAGVLFVAAAGNSGSDNDEEPQYPSNYKADNIIAVASTTAGGQLSSFSCYGNKTVDLAAPGSNIYSTVPGQAYESLSGTSMATPHVSGLAALVWMYRPSLSMQEVKSILLASVKKEPWLEGKVSTGGMINAKNALETAWAFAPPTPPAHAPLGISFEDVDGKVGAMGGTVTITAASDESDVEYYRVYFVSGAGFQLQPLGEQIPATGEREYVLEINGSIVAPQFAKALVAVSGRASGELPAILGGSAPHVLLEDYGVPESGPVSVTWGGDVDLRAGFVKGSLFVGRAKDESSITEYNVYWSGSDGTRGALLGSIPAVGFLEPSCSGPACKLLGSTVTSGGAYHYERDSYTDGESAVIAASGPGVVTVTGFDTEQYYDWLSVGSTRLSGSVGDTLPMTIDLPAGPLAITWFSDDSISGGGWSFDLVQTGAKVGFAINTTELEAPSVEVVPAYRKTEMPLGIIAKLKDYDEKMPPSPAFAPASLKFTDVDPGMGTIAGVAEVTPVVGAKAAGVTYYRLNFANQAGQRIGGGWDKIAASDATRHINISSTAIPPGAAKLIARAGNSHGLSTGYASLALVDVVPSEPVSLTFTGDMDAHENAVAGDLVVEPAQSEAGVLAYVAYWYKDGKKVEEIQRRSPSGGGSPVVFSLPLGTKKQGDEILVVSAYAWGEMEDGALVEIEDERDPRRLNAPQPIARGSVGGAEAGRGVDRQTPTLEPWLPQPSLQAQDRPIIVWSMDDEENLSTSAAHSGRVRCVVTVPGLDAQIASNPSIRAAFTRSIADELPGVQAVDVRVVRVLAVTKAKALHVAPGGRRLSKAVSQSLSQYNNAATLEFEVEVPLSALAGTLDRVEARLILLSTGGGAAARFDAALTTELQLAGALLPTLNFERSRIGEPQELGPRLIAATARHGPSGRKLEGMLETSREEGSEDEEAKAAFLAMAVATGVAVSVAAAAVAFAIKRRIAETSGLTSQLTSRNDAHELEGISIQGERHVLRDIDLPE